jgi:rod shape-determining protein MreD
MLLLAAVLQLTVPGIPILAGSKPPLLLAVVVYYAATGSLTTACWVSVAAGVIHDALSPVPIGYSVLVFGLIGLMTGELRRVVDMDQWVSRWIMGFVAGAMATLILGISLMKHDLVACSGVQVTAKALGSGVLGGMVISLVYLVAGSLRQLTGVRR